MAKNSKPRKPSATEIALVHIHNMKSADHRVTAAEVERLVSGITGQAIVNLTDKQVEDVNKAVSKIMDPMYDRVAKKLIDRGYSL